MAAFYVASYVGAGSYEDPFRPAGAFETEGQGGQWGAIDLRPDPTVAGNGALLALSARLDGPDRIYMSDGLDTTLNNPVRNNVASFFGIGSFSGGVNTPREMIVDLLTVHADQAGRWPGLRAAPDGNRQIWLLGELVAQL